MTQDIIAIIKEAEGQATAQKNAAIEKKNAMISQAEERAAEIEKTSAEVCKAYRETQLIAAEADAEKAYRDEIEKQGKLSKEYAERMIAEHAESYAEKIVGRLFGGNR